MTDSLEQRAREVLAEHMEAGGFVALAKSARGTGLEQMVAAMLAFADERAKQVEAETLERAAAVAEGEVKKQREAAASCVPWSAAQGERLRAKDAAMDIADAIRALNRSPNND